MRAVLITMAASGLLFLVLSQNACYYDNEEELYPNSCDTVAVSYAEDILPLLDFWECSACHDSFNQQGGVNLEGYENVKEYADNGRLLGSVIPLEGFEPMPLGGARLPNCDIARIESWVNAGAPNN